MIAYVRGEVVEVQENKVLLDVNQMGYQIFVPSRVAASMPSKGEMVRIHTYLHVKEDAMHLYGFLAKDDLNIFKLLLCVNGIGPKAALGILSTLSANDLRFAVISEDVKNISKAPGIGRKTAQKLILELKDKLSLEDVFEKEDGISGNESVNTLGMTDGKSEAIQALTALGYSGSDALKAVNQVETTENMDTESILKAALKKLTFL